MNPLQFLELLWHSKPMHLFLLIWIRQGKTSRWFQDVRAAASSVEAERGDVYAGVGLASRDYGPGNRCTSDEIAGIAGIWADLDLKSEAHNKPLPATIEEALTVIPAALPPTMIIWTGNGAHVWWLFEDPWIFEDDEERKQASALSSRFQTLLRYNANQNGWAFERLSDLARVLRIPGTVNAKDPSHPKEVKVYSFLDYRYNACDFERYLDEQAIPDTEEEGRVSKQLAECFTKQPLVINLDAAIPDDMLARWTEQDTRFRKTWERQRADLNDQSGSGYDLALACFGIGNGLSDQQIVDLIVHHRRIHGEQRRTRLDYYQRTLSKARKTTEARFSLANVPGVPLLVTDNGIPGEGPQVPKGTADVTKKASLCEHISRILGVRVLRIVQITGAEPVYLMYLDSGCIEFPDTTKLLSYRFVKSALAGRGGKVIRKFTSKEWDRLTQMMIDACIQQEGTDDMDFKGQGRMYINQYLVDHHHQMLASLEGQNNSASYEPVIDKGRIAISATHLQLYVSKTTMQALSVKRLATMIAALGGKSVRVRGHSFKEQSRWALPLEEWNPKDYATNAGDTTNGQ